MSAVRLAKLSTDGEWDHLRANLDSSLRNAAVENILLQLRKNGANSALIEEEYLDQDHSAVYSAFYSTVFKRHGRLCRRIHFFKNDITGSIDNSCALDSATRLQEAAEGYLGFIVARPLAHAPLGRVVVAGPANSQHTQSEVLVRAKYEAHVLGASLRLDGIAMTQQESRVGSCAQATIWAAGRHFHMRHRGPWFSTVEISDAATRLTDSMISRSLPAGSEFLTTDNMVRALSAMGREPLYYGADEIQRPTQEKPIWSIQWINIRPQDVINRYIDSGIPVILGFCPLPGQTSGHAVLATGHTIKGLPAEIKLPTNPTQAEFCENFLAHDDQRGSNIPISIDPTGATPDFPYAILSHLYYLIVPLPKKVFISAEYAEKIAWDLLQQYQTDWPIHKALHGAALGTSVALGDAFTHELSQAKVIARTYLTYGWRYKARMLQNRVGNDFKSVLFYHALPRLVWVTEFGTFNSLNHLDKRQRRIFAHNVIDATASRLWESRSIFHAPGMSVRHFHDGAVPFGDLKDATAPITDDTDYFPKVHGEDNYDLFH